MEFRLLGPVEVRDQGEAVRLGGPKQRALLAILLLRANEAVSRDALMEGIWGERLPAAASHTLDGYISKLRRALGDDRLVRRSPGYLLRVEPGELDLDCVNELVETGERAAEEGGVAQAAQLFSQALGLWRGPPLGDVANAEFARHEVDRLEQLRLTTLEQRIEAEMKAGRNGRLVGELESLVAAHPLRERLRAQLMLALYRAGRQAEALALYSETRRFMVRDLGLEPSEELRDLQRRILAQDPTLIPAPPPGAGKAIGPFPDADRHTPVERSRRLVRRSPWLWIFAAVATLAVVVAVTWFQGRPNKSRRTIGEYSVAFLDTRSGNLVGSVPAPAGASVVRVGGGSIWDNRESGVLSRIDPQTLRVTRSISLGHTMESFAVGDGAVWVIAGDSHTLLRIDPKYGRITKRIALPAVSRPGIGPIAEAAGVAIGAGSVWVAHGLAEVDRVNPTDGRVLRRIPLDDASLVAYGAGGVWVASSDLGTITKIDPRTDKKVATAQIRPWISALAVGGGYVWASNNERIWKLSDDGQQIDTIPTVSSTGDLAFGDGALWFTNDAAGLVTRVDPQTDAARQYSLGHLLTGIAVRGRILAVSVSPNANDLVGRVRGKVLQIRTGQDWIDDADPAVAAAPGTNEWPWLQQLMFATGARLLDYRDAPAPAGWELAPEVAAALPRISRDGRTYTFEIRPGFRFSPPSNEPVTAQTFRYSIERALSPRLGVNAPAVAVAADIVGVRAFRSGKAKHISGVEVRGNRLIITLLRRAPDFPERIALSYFSAVPLGTPIVPNGLRDPIPSAGPYYVGVNDGGVAAVLRANPNYHGLRPQHLDAVVYRPEPQIGAAVAAVTSGPADYIAEPDPALEPSSAVARRFSQTIGARSRYFLTPMLASDELVFDTRHGLFRSAAMRRAVNFALDRPAMAAAFNDRVTDRILPPGMPGFENRHVYPLAGPDLRRARALAAGRAGHARLAICEQPECSELGRVVEADLARIGIRVSIDQYPGDIASTTQRRGDDIVLARIFAPYPDPIATLRIALPPQFAHSVDRLALLARPQRLVAAEGAELTLLRTAAPVAAFGTPVIPELFSSRVGCKTFQPLAFGVDLGALCLRPMSGGSQVR